MGYQLCKHGALYICIFEGIRASDPSIISWPPLYVDVRNTKLITHFPSCLIIKWNHMKWLLACCAFSVAGGGGGTGQASERFKPNGLKLPFNRVLFEIVDQQQQRSTELSTVTNVRGRRQQCFTIIKRGFFVGAFRKQPVGYGNCCNFLCSVVYRTQ